MARVTIVGGGYGGITAAKALDDVAEVTPRGAEGHLRQPLRGAARCGRP